MNNLELATKEELIEELKRRTTGLVIVYDFEDKDPNNVCIFLDFSGCSIAHVLGLTNYAQERITEKIYEMNKDA